jgi:hypothetical protein
MSNSIEKIDNNDLKDYVQFQMQRNIVCLYKHHLEIIENLKIDHKFMLKKLKESFPSEVVDSFDYFDDNKYNYIRKRTLDIGNEAIRDFEKTLEKLDVGLKRKKYNE